MGIFPTKILLTTDGTEEAMLVTSTAAELAGERKEQRMDDREVLGRKTCAAILRKFCGGSSTAPLGCVATSTP